MNKNKYKVVFIRCGVPCRPAKGKKDFENSRLTHKWNKIHMHLLLIILSDYDSL